MSNLLIAVLAVSSLSLFINALFIAHELGWFPHGKRRDRPVMARQQLQSALQPTVEELRDTNRDSQVKSVIADRLRRTAHKDVYEYKEPESQLRKVLARFKAEPTASRRDDVLNLMNDITTKHELTSSLDALIEQAIEATASMPMR